MERTDIEPWEWSKAVPYAQAATLIGITRLVYPELKVEIEAVAVA